MAGGESSASQIVATVQNYDWGILGSASLVAKLGAENSGIAIDENKPYAEVPTLFFAYIVSCGWGLIQADLP
jgi:hypothetical protein